MDFPVHKQKCVLSKQPTANINVQVSAPVVHKQSQRLEGELLCVAAPLVKQSCVCLRCVLL